MELALQQYAGSHINGLAPVMLADARLYMNRLLSDLMHAVHRQALPALHLRGGLPLGPLVIPIISVDASMHNGMLVALDRARVNAIKFIEVSQDFSIVEAAVSVQLVQVKYDFTLAFLQRGIHARFCMDANLELRVRAVVDTAVPEHPVVTSVLEVQGTCCDLHVDAPLLLRLWLKSAVKRFFVQRCIECCGNGIRRVLMHISRLKYRRARLERRTELVRSPSISM